MKKSVVIDCFPESARRYTRGHAIVAVDVIRATTTIATAVSMGRRCFPVPTLEAAARIAKRFRNPLLAGEIGGVIPPGFEMNNSPAEMALRTDVRRPLVLLSSSGTKLIHMVRKARAVYIACFRNLEFLTAHLTARHRRIAVIGAGNRGEFRQEDQMCCAWIARELIEAGFSAENRETATIVERWREASINSILSSASVAYLKRSGQTRDLEFILSHIGDLELRLTLERGEIIGHTPASDDSSAAEWTIDQPSLEPAYEG